MNLMQGSFQIKLNYELLFLISECDGIFLKGTLNMYQ